MYKRKCRKQVKDSLKLTNANVKISKRGNEKQKEFKKNLKNISRGQTVAVSKNNENGKSKRVTIPLEFFSKGIKSKTVRKAKVNGNVLNQQNKNFLNADLHALLQTVSNSSTKFVKSPVARHSKCLSTKRLSIQSHYENITDYFVQLQSETAGTEDISNACGEDILKYQNISRSNSGFKEISCIFENTIQQTSSKKLNKSIKKFEDGSVNINHSSSDKKNINMASEFFCLNLKKQLASASLNSGRIKCGKRINSLVEHINTVLEGKEVNYSAKTNCLIKQIYQKDEPVSTVNLLPKCKWIYKTPIKQRLKRPSICNTSQLVPCFLQAINTSKILMEIDLNSSNLLQETYATSYYNNYIFSTLNKDPLINFALQSKTDAITNVNISPIQDSKPLYNEIASNIRFNEISKFVKTTSSTKFTKYFNFDTAMHKQNGIWISNQKLNKSKNLNHIIKKSPFLSNNCEDPTYSYLGDTKLPHGEVSEISFPYAKWNSNETANEKYYTAYDEFRGNQINNEHLLFPSKPELNEPSPLEFQPRKIFDTK